MRAGGRLYVLRRFGAWLGAEDGPAWELEVVERLAAVGLPVPAPVTPPRMVDGAMHVLMPWLPGRALGVTGGTEAVYRDLGRRLADYHAVVATLPTPPQRPGWTSQVDSALPLEGGRARRAELLWHLTQADPDLGARFTAAAEALEARDLPTVFASSRRLLVHGDFSPWNLRVRGGKLTALLDFEMAHVDVRAADLAYARRGYHDAVVTGYLERADLPAVELAALDGLWIAGILRGLWRVLENRIEERSELAYGLGWDVEQLGKTRGYVGG